MSRIGTKSITIPAGTIVTVDDLKVTVAGPKGSLSWQFRPEIEIVVESSRAVVNLKRNNPQNRALHGLSRTLLANMVIGVTQGWNKGLELVGVGYRVALSEKSLVLNVGFSHQVNFPAPDGITFEVKDNTQINVMGINKQLVGETASQIRRVKPPEPYKGKGIRYVGERVIKKAGKAAKGATAGK